MIFGPQYSHPINRVERVDADPQEEDQNNRKKRRVLYQGRAWSEEEEKNLPVQPSSSEAAAVTPQPEHPSVGVFADHVLLERAQELFKHLTTLEEKVAQLCFLATDAVYNARIQHDVELLIQAWQIGGILFQKGNYRRQAYLIERYQEVSKTPLLISNDFLHGLSFYLQGDSLPKEISKKHYSDLGKAVMNQNRRLGVHIQFDRERGYSKIEMEEGQAKAFRKGIREAQGIVGKEKAFRQQEKYAFSAKNAHPLLSAVNESSKISNLFSNYQIQETIGFKTLTFFDGTNVNKASLEKALYQAFLTHYDVFLLSGNITEAIRAIMRLVHAGKISEEMIDRHVMKALIIKSLFFK